MEQMWAWVTFFVLLLGMAGTILPLLPGLPVMALAVLVYGWAEGFQEVAIWYVALTIIVAIIGTAADYLSGPYAAKKLGAGRGGIWGAVIGGIVGMMIFGFLGLIAGPFIGSFLGELLYGKHPRQAAKVGLGSVLGVASATVWAEFLDTSCSTERPPKRTATLVFAITITPLLLYFWNWSTAASRAFFHLLPKLQ